MKIFRSGSTQFAVNLRWLSGYNITRDAYEEFENRYTGTGVKVFGSNDCVSFGFLENESDVALSEDSFLYSLAESASRYKGNAIFITKLLLEGTSYYWVCLVSNGVPYIDYADQELANALRPVINRFNTVGGDSILSADNCSVIRDESVIEDLENSEEYNEILLLRDRLVETDLGWHSLVEARGEIIAPIRFGKSLSIGGTLPKLLGFLAVCGIALFVIMYDNIFTKESYTDYDQTEIEEVIEVANHDNDVRKDVAIFMAGSDATWLVESVRAYNKWQHYLLPFVKEKSICKITDKNVLCKTSYIRTQSSESARPAYNFASKNATSVSTDSTLSRLDLQQFINVNLRPKSADVFSNLPDFNEVSLTVDEINSSELLPVSITMAGAAGVSVGGKRDYFASLPQSTKELLTMNAIHFSANGIGFPSLQDLIYRLPGNTRYSLITLTGSLEIAWQLEGDILTREKISND